MINEMITTETAEAALDHLKGTDEKDAKLKSNLEWLKEKKKNIIALAQDESDKTSQAAKEQDALTSFEYTNWLEEYKAATYDYLLCHNKRASAALQIEMWRSINANQRSGNI